MLICSIFLCSPWPNTHVIVHRQTQESPSRWRTPGDLCELSELFLLLTWAFGSASVTATLGGKVCVRAWDLKIYWWAKSFPASFSWDISHRDVSGPQGSSFLFLWSFKWLVAAPPSNTFSSPLFSYRKGGSVHSLCWLPLCPTSSTPQKVCLPALFCNPRTHTLRTPNCI